MRIVFIETDRLTNEIIRAVAGAAPNCVGYPDGVPESWRDVAPVKQGGGLVPDLPMKRFTDETEGGAGGGAAFPDHELDPAALGKCALCFFDGGAVCRKCGAFAEGNPRSTYPMGSAALLGPVDGHVFGLWGDGSGPVGGARHRAWLRRLSRFTGPVDWPDERGDDEC